MIKDIGKKRVIYMTLEKILAEYGYEILGNKSIFKKEVSNETVKEYRMMLERLKRPFKLEPKKQL